MVRSHQKMPLVKFRSDCVLKTRHKKWDCQGWRVFFLCGASFSLPIIPLSGKNISPCSTNDALVRAIFSAVQAANPWIEL